MVSMTAVMRSTYYVLRMFPLLLLPLQMRTHIRRAAGAFEDQLLQNGLDPEIAHVLADSFERANKEMIRQFTSPKTWAGED